MSTTNLKVEVHCIKPSWVDRENNKYRVYVNQDLITERTWRWTPNTHVEEQLIVELPLDTEHTVKIVPILSKLSSAEFLLRNLTIDDQPYPHRLVNELELSFKK